MRGIDSGYFAVENRKSSTHSRVYYSFSDLDPEFYRMDSFEILKKIGDGTFGTVYLCRKSRSSPGKIGTNPDDHSTPDVVSKELFAVKKMKKRFYNWDDCMKLREIKALKKLNHENIVTLKEVIREDNHLYLIFEYMDQNLYQLIKAQSNQFTENAIKEIVKQLIKGLSYIHKKGFFHRDIKPENILCMKGSNRIKIADFGLIREIDAKPPFTDYVSTRWYRAPELLLHSKDYNLAVDIWAVGCITGEMYTLRPMFPGRSEIDQIFKICQAIGAPDTTAWPEGQRLACSIKFEFPNIVPLNLSSVLVGCSTDGLSFIESLLQWIPARRPMAIDLLDHSYFKNL